MDRQPAPTEIEPSADLPAIELIMSLDDRMVAEFVTGLGQCKYFDEIHPDFSVAPRERLRSLAPLIDRYIDDPDPAADTLRCWIGDFVQMAYEGSIESFQVESDAHDDAVAQIGRTLTSLEVSLGRDLDDLKTLTSAQ